MKKLLTIGTSIATFFTLTIPAFALDNKSLNPCDNNTNDALKAACAGQGLSLGSVLGFVITIAFIIAILVALLFLIWGGIKYILSQGAPEETNKAKDTIMYAVFGIVIVMLSFVIVNYVIGRF